MLSCGDRSDIRKRSSASRSTRSMEIAWAAIERASWPRRDLRSIMARGDGGSGGKSARSTPLPGQEFVDPPRRMIGQPSEDIGEPGARIDAVELGGLDQGVDGGGTAAAFVGTGEGPVVAADRNSAQRPLGGIVGHAEPAVVEEPGERRPALEDVVDRLGDIVLPESSGPLLAQTGSKSATRAGCAPCARQADAPLKGR